MTFRADLLGQDLLTGLISKTLPKNNGVGRCLSGLKSDFESTVRPICNIVLLTNFRTPSLLMDLFLEWTESKFSLQFLVYSQSSKVGKQVAHAMVRLCS